MWTLPKKLMFASCMLIGIGLATLANYHGEFNPLNRSGQSTVILGVIVGSGLFIFSMMLMSRSDKPPAGNSKKDPLLQQEDDLEFPGALRLAVPTGLGLWIVVFLLGFQVKERFC